MDLIIDAAPHVLAGRKQEPSVSESLLRPGHWCQSPVCPQKMPNADVASAQADRRVPLISMGHWCESTTCPLV